MGAGPACSNTAQDAAANFPCMFIGHSQIVAFLLHRFHAHQHQDPPVNRHGWGIPFTLARTKVRRQAQPPV